MLDYKRVIGMHYASGYSGHEIAKSLHCSKSTVNEFLRGLRRSFT